MVRSVNVLFHVTSRYYFLEATFLVSYEHQLRLWEAIISDPINFHSSSEHKVQLCVVFMPDIQPGEIEYAPNFTLLLFE